MVYAYNTLSERLVCATGGGTIYVGQSYRNPDDKSHLVAISELSAFIAAHPEGGDVTDIIQRHRDAAKD